MFRVKHLKRLLKQYDDELPITSDCRYNDHYTLTDISTYTDENTPKSLVIEFAYPSDISDTVRGETYSEPSQSTENKGFVYILEEYMFYEGMSVLLVSTDYDYVRRIYENRMGELPNGYGLRITKYKLNTYYKNILESGESMDWVEKDYDGNFKNIRLPPH